MGDNIWLPDRDASRTPMQWTPDRNAGFSTADPGKLFLPVVQSLVYNYTWSTSESQLAQSRSLLHWVRNVIHVRKAHPAFGLGTHRRCCETDHESVLAFVRSYEGSGTQFGDSRRGRPLRVQLRAQPGRRCTIDGAASSPARTLFDLFGGGAVPDVRRRRHGSR